MSEISTIFNMSNATKVQLISYWARIFHIGIKDCAYCLGILPSLSIWTDSTDMKAICDLQLELMRLFAGNIEGRQLKDYEHLVTVFIHSEGEVGSVEDDMSIVSEEPIWLCKDGEWIGLR